VSGFYTKKLMADVFLDFETFSSVDIRNCGAYKYTSSPDFEPLMLAYSTDKRNVYAEDLLYTSGELPMRLIKSLEDEDCLIHAHNATFERLVLRAMGYDIDPKRFRCSAIKASYCGLPMSLDNASKALGLDNLKDAEGKALIRFFCVPQRGKKKRNLPEDDFEKWDKFLEYCRQDVVVEIAILEALEDYEIPDIEWEYYFLDQKINDRGFLIDTNLVENAIAFDTSISNNLKGKLKKLTGLDNPNSPKQLCGWLSDKLQKDITSVAKSNILDILESSNNELVGEVLGLKQLSAKTSVKKYSKALSFLGADSRVRGLLQFYGAGRTGRWAGRGIQVHNLPRNYLKDLDLARNIVKSGDLDLLCMLYDNPKNILSELIRTMFIAPKNCKYMIADYSAIEARVIAWLAGESWRIDVFNTHGKIYEASAAMMFGIPIESISKGSDYRMKGKVAELALGYQGALGALIKMGGEAMGLSEEEMENIVRIWRKANPKIVSFWKNLERSAIRAISAPNQVISLGDLKFLFDGMYLTIELPSGRSLYYREAQIITKTRYGKACKSVRYKTLIQDSSKWDWTDTYGGKLAENVVQAISRDLLADALYRLDKADFKIVGHVHDEVIIEEFLRGLDMRYDEAIDIMCANPSWATGLPLGADGFTTDYYMKD